MDTVKYSDQVCAIIREIEDCNDRLEESIVDTFNKLASALRMDGSLMIIQDLIGVASRRTTQLWGLQRAIREAAHIIRRQGGTEQDKLDAAVWLSRPNVQAACSTRTPETPPQVETEKGGA